MFRSTRVARNALSRLLKHAQTNVLNSSIVSCVQHPIIVGRCRSGHSVAGMRPGSENDTAEGEPIPPVIFLPAPKRVFVPSQEQSDIVERCRINNVMVSARPGAGKTATAEALVQANPDVPIAVVTYSKRLQIETQQRLAEYPNVDVYTFHGLAGKLFGGTIVNNDDLLLDLRNSRTLPTESRILRYRYLVLDELQDLTENLYWLMIVYISAITQFTGRAPQILALGDARQAIFEFQGADARFLDLAPELFSSVSPYDWEACQLSKSFRLSHETTSFINNAILGGEQYIVGAHSGPRPLYVNADPKRKDELLDVLLPFISKYGPDNTAILVPSMKIAYVRDLSNSLLEKHRILNSPSVSDDTRIDPDIIRGKVAISTYHQFKGSERDLVVIFGADSKYFETGRSLPDDRCPNAVFVALTRARKQLIMVQFANSFAMPFVDMSALSRDSDLLNLAETSMDLKAMPGRPAQYGLSLSQALQVSRVARHVGHEELQTLLKNHLRIVKRSPLPDGFAIRAPDKVCTDDARQYYEATSDLNGIAVTAAFQWSKEGKISAPRLPPASPRVPPKDKYRHAVWFARHAAKVDAAMTGFRARYGQLRGHPFDWLVPHLAPAIARLRGELKEDGALESGTSLQFEVAMQHELQMQDPDTSLLHQTTFLGSADMIHLAGTESSSQVATIWEIKLVSVLSPEHVVQAVIYGYIWALKEENLAAPFPRILLYNVRDGARWDIHTTLEEAHQLIEGVLLAKYTDKGSITTENFLQGCADVREDVEDLFEPLLRRRRKPERMVVKASTDASAEPSKRKSRKKKIAGDVIAVIDHVAADIQIDQDQEAKAPPKRRRRAKSVVVTDV